MSPVQNRSHKHRRRNAGKHRRRVGEQVWTTAAGSGVPFSFDFLDRNRFICLIELKVGNPRTGIYCVGWTGDLSLHFPLRPNRPITVARVMGKGQSRRVSCRAWRLCWTAASLASSQHRQLGDIGRDPPRLIAGQQLGCRSPPRLILEINIRKRLSVVVAALGREWLPWRAGGEK